MPNVFKYNSSSTEAKSLRKGNFYIGTGDVGKGPTNQTGFYNGAKVGDFSYVIVLHRGENVPTFYQIQNDTELIERTNQIDKSVVRTTKEECFIYFANQSDRLIVNKDVDPFITDGLVLGLDGNYLPSYPATFSISYDISNLATQPKSIVKNFSLQLTSWSVRRSDISLVTNIPPPFPGAQVWSSTINTTSYANTLHRVWNLGSSNGIIGSLGSGFYRYYLWARGASHNSASAAITIDISDGGGIAQATSTVATSSVWRVLSAWDNVSSVYNADKFFDYALSGTNGDTIYISSIVIAAYDVASSNDLTKLHSFPGPIDYGKTASVQKQGTLWNGVSFSPTEGSFNLDGSNDYIEVGSEPSLNFGTGDFTALCWVGGLTAHPGSAKSIIWKGSRFDGNVAGWSITWAGSPQDLYFIISSDSARLEGRTVPNSGLNGWQGYKMIGLQRSGSSWRQINGTTVTQLGTFTGNVDSTNSVFIGRNGHYNTYLSNLVNKVLIYNRALSQTEINQNYYQGSIVTDGLTFSVDSSNIISYDRVGTSWYNLSGSLYTGDLQNGPTFSFNNGGTLYFDGNNDIASFGTGSNFDFVDFTAGIWAKSPTNTSGALGYPIHVTNLIGKGNWNDNNSWRIGYKSTGSDPATFITFGYGIGWSGGPQLSVGSFDLSNWNYFVGVATTTQQLLYLNGVLVSTVNTSKISVANTFDLQIGRSSYTSRFFTGNVGPSHIYNRALSSSEILQNFNAYKSRYVF